MVVDGPTAGERGLPAVAPYAASRDDLASAFARLARELDRLDDAESLLAAIVRGAVALVPGAEDASFGRAVGRHQLTAHATASGALAAAADRIQDEEQEGPARDAIRDQQPVRAGDLGAEVRWPRFAPRAAAAGLAGILSLPLSARGGVLGALNLYARTANAFTDETVLVGQLYAGHAAIALAGLRVRDQLREAVQSRDLIGQAKGILMERYAINGDDAFALLARSSQQVNRKLSDIAGELVRTGTLAGLRRPATSAVRR